MTKKGISEYDIDMYFLITDNNTNLTKINSINHNVTLINDYLTVQATSMSSEQFFSVVKLNIQLVLLRTGYQQRIFVQASALKLGMKQILLKIIRKINKISTIIII